MLNLVRVLGILGWAAGLLLWAPTGFIGAVPAAIVWQVSDQPAVRYEFRALALGCGLVILANWFFLGGQGVLATVRWLVGTP